MSRAFLSCVSTEFELYRTLLTRDLRRARVDLRVQEDFGVAGGTLLAALDEYIRDCSAVIHLVGKCAGTCPEDAAVSALLNVYGDLIDKVPDLRDLLSQDGGRISYTQWESDPAIYHGRKLHIYLAAENAPRGSRFALNPDDAALQAAHFKRISSLGRQWGRFENEERLSNYVLADLRDIFPPPEQAFNAAPSRLPGGTEVFEGREKTFHDLDRLWADAFADTPGAARIVSLVAIGGAGKTAVVSRWKNALLERGNRSGVERYFDWSFYNQGAHAQAGKGETDTTEFVAAALKFFGDSTLADQVASPWDKGAKLAALAAEHRTLLVLDGLEPLQHPPGPQQGEIRDDAIRALFAGLQTTSRGLCIVTTRVHVRDLDATTLTTTPQWSLDHLTDVAGAAVLRAHGIVGPQSELEAASREVNGHALTLGLMGRYLRLAFDPPDIVQRDCFHFSEADAEIRNGSAFRALTTYDTWFESEGRRVEAAILRVLGLFDRPATPDCLTALCSNPPIAGLTEPLIDLSQAQWNAAIQRLRDLDLVQTLEWMPPRISGYGEALATRAMEEGFRNQRTDLGPPQPFERPHDSSVVRRSLDTHPIVREYSAAKLKENGIATAAQARLFEHLCASVPYWPEGREGLLPLYQAIVHGCKAARHLDSFKVLQLRINRGWTGPQAKYSSDQLGLVGLDLAGIACFFITPWRVLPKELPENRQSLLLNAASLALSAVNRHAEAREPIKAALEIAIVLQSWRNACICGLNLSQLELDLGNVAEAEAAIKESRDYADRGQSPRDQIYVRAQLASVMHQAGRLTESRESFAAAESLQPEHEHAYPLLYAVHGFDYCNLLLQEAECAAWRSWTIGTSAGTDSPNFLETLAAVESRAEQTLEWVSRGQAWPLPIGLDHLTLGRVSLLRAILTEAPAPGWIASTRQHIQLALEWVQRANDIRFIAYPLLAAAWFHSIVGEWEVSQQYLDQAFQLATRGGAGRSGAAGCMRLHLIDTLLHRGRIFGLPAGRRGAPEQYPWAGRTPRGDLEEAEKLIADCGYHRRDQELRYARDILPSA